MGRVVLPVMTVPGAKDASSILPGLTSIDPSADNRNQILGFPVFIAGRSKQSQGLLFKWGPFRGQKRLCGKLLKVRLKSPCFSLFRKNPRCRSILRKYPVLQGFLCVFTTFSGGANEARTRDPHVAAVETSLEVPESPQHRSGRGGNWDTGEYLAHLSWRTRRGMAGLRYPLGEIPGRRLSFFLHPAVFQ
jgi:hypothetical protein